MVNRTALQVVCDLAHKHKLRPSDILHSRERTAKVARVRQIAYREVQAAKGWSAYRVAQYFNRHPSTVSYALKRYPGIAA